MTTSTTSSTDERLRRTGVYAHHDTDATTVAMADPRDVDAVGSFDEDFDGVTRRIASETIAEE